MRRNHGGERKYEVLRDGESVGTLYVWNHGGACTFDTRGAMIRDLSAWHCPGMVVDALAPKVELQEALF